MGAISADLAAARTQPSYHYAYWGGIDRDPSGKGPIPTIGVELITKRPRAWGTGAGAPHSVAAEHHTGDLRRPWLYQHTRRNGLPVEGSLLERELLVPYSGESRCAYLHTVKGVMLPRRAACVFAG